MNSFIVQTIEAFWDSPNRNTWVKGLVITGVLGFSILIALTTSMQIQTAILMLIALMGAFIVLLRWPELGLLGVICGSFFIAFTGPGGVNIAVIGAAGLSGLWILDMLIRQHKIVLSDKMTTIPIFFFILSAFISFIVGQLPWYPIASQAPLTAQAGGLAIFLFSALIFLMVGNAVSNLRWLQVISVLYVAIGGLYILGRMVPQVGSIFVGYYHNSAVSNSVFWVWLVIIPFSQALINNHLPKFIRAGLLAFVAATFYVAFVTASDWKSGYLPPLAGMATIVALMLRKKIFFLAPVMVGFAYSLGTEAIATDQYSYITRLDAWGIVVELGAISPLFGLGFSNYYWYTHLKPILGWRVAFNSHSQYVDLFAQTGIVGLVVYFWVLWAIWRLGWSLRDRAPEGFSRAYVYGVLGGVIAILVSGSLGDWILPFVYNVGMNGFRSSVICWVFLGGLVAIQRFTKNEAQSKMQNNTHIEQLDAAPIR